MTYLEYFHFDNLPFPTDGNANYFYPRKSNMLKIEQISKYCRFLPGVYFVLGSDGCGKSTLLSILSQQLSNNDFVINIHASNSTDILKSIASSFNIKLNHDIDIIFNELQYIHFHGQNIILIIDDANNLSKEQLINLNSLLDAVDYLRVILCGNYNIKKLLSQKVVSPIRNKIVKKYNIKYFSYLEGIKYISFISRKALALSEYSNPITFPAILLLSFISNRNIHNINFVTTSALKLAFSMKSPKVSFFHVFNVAKSNFELVRNNIYLKFQKIFIGILVLFTLFFLIKISIDRYNTITTLEARKSVARQEIELRF